MYAKADYNLSVSTYVEQEDTREKVDIVKLNAELAKISEFFTFLYPKVANI